MNVGDVLYKASNFIFEYDERMVPIKDKPLKCKVVYIHPLKRFYTVEFNRGLRESYLMIDQ